jgi:GNAT superfamily N-acetyltransferase
MTAAYYEAGQTERSTADGPGLVVRRAVVGDARSIAEIGVLSWQAAYRGLLPDDFLSGLSVEARAVAWDMLLDGAADLASPAWVAERDGHVVGYVSTGPPRDEDVPLPAAEVYAIYVLPAAWHGGVGGALMQRAVAAWRSRQIERLVLWVLEGNSHARRFYEAMGWVPDGGLQEIDLGGIAPREVRYRLEPPRLIETPGVRTSQRG